ncbi:interleukin-6 receptor subunit beta-like isoform X3 [Brachyhypopomus gauderio]|uniref:interleukin-6 receptor subunit beta-like isoform X3 n=1 Tax=Brachyhypopomus gauderio TaxID=698409 RepID=UPI004041EE54
MDCSILLFVPLLVGRLAASESLFSPRELHCVFFAYANVSCYWKPGVKTPLVINYTLQVNLTGLKSELCHSPHTHCSVQVGSLNRPYCIRVLAHISQQETASSDTLCLNGIDAAQLPAPHSFWMSPNRPRCMRLRWSAPKNFPLTNQSIRNGYLLYELQYTTPHQPAPRSLALDLREEVHCVFSPCTPYRARIRLRYNHALSHWSGWSQSSTQRTSAEAPSSTPQLWRAIQMPDMKGFRPVTLLWKAPLTQAQCAALWYTVHCKLEDPNAAVDIGDCTDLGPANTSCHFTVPAQTCICSLSMSNSAGSSPSAIITIPSQWETEPRLLDTVQVTPLGGFRLKVRWTVLESFTLTGFVVEWCITTENTHCQGAPQWQRVEQTTNGTIIIEGVQANMCYSVSVKAQRGNRSGPGLTALAYSHQAVLCCVSVFQRPLLVQSCMSLNMAVPMWSCAGALFPCPSAMVLSPNTLSTTRVKTIPHDSFSFQPILSSTGLLVSLAGVGCMCRPTQTQEGDRMDPFCPCSLTRALLSCLLCYLAACLWQVSQQHSVFAGECDRG